MTTADIQRTIEAVWRIESARLIGGLTRIVREVGLAEELAQDALVAALEEWPDSGVPENPGAWLMAAAKNRAIDLARSRRRREARHPEIGREHAERHAVSAGDIERALDDDVGDDVLRLVFATCHPILSAEARVALTLRLVGGLSTAEIARAYLTHEATIAQRIVRAKRTLVDAEIEFEVPSGAELSPRLGSVLEVVYLIFNEGYAATAGDAWIRTELCDEALRLGRILQGLAPDEPEVHGLAALMELQASRSHARVGPSGEIVLLLDQDRSRWDRLLIRRGLGALDRATQLGGASGPYVLQAALAASHARAATAADTDWARIAAIYAELAQVMPSPIVELNRAVAIGMAEGPAAALVLVDTLVAEPALAKYHLLPSVRGDLLWKLERFAEARSEFERAAAMTRNERERDHLRERAEACSRALASI